MAYSAAVEDIATGWGPSWRVRPLAELGIGRRAPRGRTDGRNGAQRATGGDPRAEVWTLGTIYVFDDYETVRSFLWTNSDARAGLVLAYPHIAESFGAGAVAVLSVEPDFDEEGEPEVLVRVA